jgi:hypothetical protein
VLGYDIPKWDDEDGLAQWLADWFTGYAPRLYCYGTPPEMGRVTPHDLDILEMENTKQPKRGPGGRPKMTMEQRREDNPIHDAAALFPDVVDELQSAFPKKPAAVIYDRALELTARIMLVKGGGQQLKYYLDRSRNDRRRID